MILGDDFQAVFDHQYRSAMFVDLSSIIEVFYHWSKCIVEWNNIIKKIALSAVLTTLSLTGFTSISSASPVPTHTCAVPGSTVLQRDGYSLGENLYVFDNSVALEAYQDPKDQLPFKDAHGAIIYFSDGQITVATYPDGGQIELPDGQIFSCTAYKDDGLSEGADGLAYSSITRAEPNADGARLQKLGDSEEIFISEYG